MTSRTPLDCWGELQSPECLETLATVGLQFQIEEDVGVLIETFLGNQ